MFAVYVFYHNLKEKEHIKIDINSTESNFYVGNQYYYYLGLLKISCPGPCNKKLSCLCLMKNK